jgi:hypothetical protein
MRPELCTAVLLPDGAWHDVEPGSMSENGARVVFVEQPSGEEISVGMESVLAARGGKTPTPPPLRRIPPPQRATT